MRIQIGIVLIALLTLGIQADRSKLRVLASPVTENNPLVNEENKEKANAVSDGVLKQIREFRGGSDDFYHDLLDAFKIIMCQQKVDGPPPLEGHSPEVRFVTKDDPAAYKDDDGECIRVGMPEGEVQIAYQQEKCEVKPNCYWDVIVEGDDYRATVYDLEQTRKLPPEGSLTFNDANLVVQNWVKGLLIFVAPGIVLAVLSLLTMLLFVLCRCCCNKCGGRSPRPGGYTCSEKLIPIIFFIIFAAGILASAAVSLLFNTQVTGAVTDVFSIARNTLGNSSDWIDNVRAPLVGIRDEVHLAVDDVQEQLNGTDFIEYGLDGMTERLRDFGTHTSDIKLPRGCVEGVDLHCVPCDVCTTISTSVSQSADQMENAASDGVEALASVKEGLEGELVNAADTIELMVGDRVTATDELKVGIQGGQNSVDEIKIQWNNQEGTRDAGVLALFALAIVVVAIGLVGVIFGLTPLRCLAKIIHIAYIIGFIALFIGFLLAAVFIAFSVLLGDMCEVSRLMRDDWGPLIGRDAAKGLNACFHNQSLLVAFELESAMDFQDKIPFPENMNLNAMLDFSNFDDFASTITDTNTSTFDVDETDVANLITELNRFTGANTGSCTPNDNNYAISNIVTPWEANAETGTDGEQYMSDRYAPHNSDCAATDFGLTSFPCSQGQSPCNYNAFVLEIYTNASSLQQIRLDAAEFITDMKANMTKVMDYVGDFKHNITEMDANINEIQTTLTGNLYGYVDDFKAAMYCNFIGDHYDDLFNAMCGDMMPAFLMISLMVFLMSVCLIPVNICLIILCKRLRASGNGTVIAGETEFK